MSGEPTSEQQQAIVEVGQKLVDTIADEIQARNLHDLQFVINILVAVSAHYIAGIGDDKIRHELFEYFGGALRKHIDVGVEAGGAARIHIFDVTRPN